MVNTVWVNADHGHNLHPLADHMTELQHFTNEENRNFSAFRFLLQLMLEQATTYKSCTNELACCSGY